MSIYMYVCSSNVTASVQWNFRGMPKAATVTIRIRARSFFIFLHGSHKCAYPTDIELSSERGNQILSLSVCQNSFMAIGTPTLSPAFRHAERAKPIDHGVLTM